MSAKMCASLGSLLLPKVVINKRIFCFIEEMLNGRVRNEVAEVGKREQENVIVEYLQLLQFFFFLFSV